MAWLDLEEDLAEMFGEGDVVDDLEIDARCRHGARRTIARDPPPHTRAGRVLGAIVRGERLPKGVARVTGIHHREVVDALKFLRKTGRITHSAEGWTLS